MKRRARRNGARSALRHCHSLNGMLGAILSLAVISAGQAEAHDSGSSALLAISLNQARLTAGMMCNGVDPGSFGLTRELPMCRRGEARSDLACKSATANILNHDVLAFDVTTWPRQAIAELASRVLQADDPLSHDYSEQYVADRRVRRVDESQDERDVASPVFEFSFGCYLLIKVPASYSVSGT